MHRVVIAGVSTRAAAESAARAGFEVTAIDAFADLDQHPSVRAMSVPRPFTPRAAARAARIVECDAVAYLSNFENHPDDVAALAAGRKLWGNPPEVLSRVRDPKRLAQALLDRGISVPEVRFDAGSIDHFPRRATAPPEWLLKPLASGGGHGIRKWLPGTTVPDGWYLQESIAGVPGSVVFVAARGSAIPLGVSRQLVGDPAFGATGYRYCGSILGPGGEDDSLSAAASVLATAVAEAFDLVGVNGVDFIACGERLYAVEVNPRWTSSMELVEWASGLSVFGAHAIACRDGALPGGEVRRRAGAFGKAIVFARRDTRIGDTSGWLDDPSVRDVPRAGEWIRAGRPICTVFAETSDAGACQAALVRRAAQIFKILKSSI